MHRPRQKLRGRASGSLPYQIAEGRSECKNEIIANPVSKALIPAKYIAYVVQPNEAAPAIFVGLSAGGANESSDKGMRKAGAPVRSR